MVMKSVIREPWQSNSICCKNREKLICNKTMQKENMAIFAQSVILFWYLKIYNTSSWKSCYIFYVTSMIINFWWDFSLFSHLVWFTFKYSFSDQSSWNYGFNIIWCILKKWANKIIWIQYCLSSKLGKFSFAIFIKKIHNWPYYLSTQLKI